VRTQASEPTAAVKAKILQIIWENHGKSTRNHGFFPILTIHDAPLKNDEWELGDFLQQKCNAHLYVCLAAGWMAACLYVRPSVRLYVCNVCMVDKSGWDANQQEHVDECS
jgi:hypothetical protein